MVCIHRQATAQARVRKRGAETVPQEVSVHFCIYSFQHGLRVPSNAFLNLSQFVHDHERFNIFGPEDGRLVLRMEDPHWSQFGACV